MCGALKLVLMWGARTKMWGAQTRGARTSGRSNRNSNQALDNNEILNVRWATDDPNPWVQKRKVESSKEKLAAAILQDYDGPLSNQGDVLEGHLRPQKHRCHDREFQDHGEAVGYYPDTDYQYSEVNNKSDTQVSQSPTMSYRTASNSQPKTLSDLIKWSKEQASLNRRTELPHSKHTGMEISAGKKNEGSLSLVSAYDSSSDDESGDKS